MRKHQNYSILQIKSVEFVTKIGFSHHLQVRIYAFTTTNIGIAIMPQQGGCLCHVTLNSGH